MTDKNVQYKVLNESSIFLSCFAAFNAISSIFLRSSNNWKGASQALKAPNLCFMFHPTPFKTNFVCHYIANSCLTNLHISHIIQCSVPLPPPGPLSSMSRKRAPLIECKFVFHILSLYAEWLAGWLAVWRNHWMTVRISDTCLIRYTYTWYQVGCLIGWMTNALTLDICIQSSHWLCGYLIRDLVTENMDIWYLLH